MSDSQPSLADVALIDAVAGTRRRRVSRNMAQMRRLMLVALGVLLVFAVFGLLIYLNTLN